MSVPMIIEAIAATTEVKLFEGQRVRKQYLSVEWAQCWFGRRRGGWGPRDVEFEIAMYELSICQPRVNEYTYMYIENERASEYSRVPVIPSPRWFFSPSRRSTREQGATDREGNDCYSHSRWCGGDGDLVGNYMGEVNNERGRCCWEEWRWTEGIGRGGKIKVELSRPQKLVGETG